MLGALTKGPAAYVARTGWPGWVVLPAAVVILALAGLLAVGVAWAVGLLAGPVPAADASGARAHVTLQLVAWLVGLQAGVVLLTLVAAGFFSSARRRALALMAPAQGWGVLPLALAPLFAGTLAWTGLLLWWSPTIVVHDLRPFQELLRGDVLWLVLIVICIGAPLSEELLFRGFIFSGLAKTRLGLIGTSVVTTVLWTGLHAGYSIFGLIEVLGIGLYLSWILVRTGSLWVTIFCHGVYNTVVAITLLFITLPAPG